MGRRITLPWGSSTAAFCSTFPKAGILPTNQAAATADTSFLSNDAHYCHHTPTTMGQKKLPPPPIAEACSTGVIPSFSSSSKSALQIGGWEGRAAKLWPLVPARTRKEKLPPPSGRGKGSSWSHSCDMPAAREAAFLKILFW